MLLVSGFKPFQTNYNNQGVNKANFNQPQLRVKADSVNFTSIAPAADRQAQAEVASLVRRVQFDYPRFFGAGFKIFADDMTNFLEKHGLFFQHETGSVRLKTRPELTAGFDGHVDNAFKVNLIDGDGDAIHLTNRGGLPGGGYSVIDVTKNAANVGIFRRLLTGNLPLIDRYSPHYDIPNASDAQDLKAQTKIIMDALIGFRRGWRNIHYSDQNLKAQNLQDAYRILMPEE